jgi:hypothetical protein
MRYLVATINHSHAGFFAYVNFSINQIVYAQKHDLTPVIYFGPVSRDGSNAFYDAGRGDNIWDYYFEPVDGITHDQLQAKIADPEDDLDEDDVKTLSTEELWDIHCKEAGSVFVYPHSMHRRATIDDAWYETQRDKGRRLVDRYVRVKSHVMDKVNAFADEHFGTQLILGTHMRGTDKGTAHASADLMRVVPPDEYFPHIDAYFEEHGGGKIFIATDQRQFIDDVRTRYGNRTLAYDAIRGSSDLNPFEVNDGKGYRKREEALIDCLLLSRCDYLLRCTSAVGEFAQYFNPEIRSKDLNLTRRKMSFFKRYFFKKWRKRRMRGLAQKQRQFLEGEQG